MRYVIVSCTIRGVIDPPEPVPEESQAVLEEQDRYEEILRAERVMWNTGYMPETRRRREVA